MLKNQKWTILLVSVAVIVIAVSGFFIWKLVLTKDATTSTTTPNSSGPVSLNSASSSESISLEPKKSTNTSGLSVNDAQSNSANLGSGSRQQVNSSNSSSSRQDDFSQYEQYKDKNEVYFGDIVVGTGAVAAKDSQLAVTYKGYLTTGEVFDQSRAANNGQLQPLLFTLGGGQLIPGFEQGVAGMKVGGSRRVIIPPSLGYGANEQGTIPANSVLIFDIQLLTAQ